MAEKIDRSERETEGHAFRPSRFECVKGAEQEPEEGRMGITIRRQSPHTLDHPRPTSQAFQVFSEILKRADDIKMIDGNQLGVGTLEQHQLTVRKELEGTSKF
jgi:hypothetical protein